MDVVASAASTVVRESTAALQVAAEELAKQANSVAQLATAKDPISWLTGEDDPGDDPDGAFDDRLPALVPVPLAALQPWGAGWACEAFGPPHSSCSSTAPAPGGAAAGSPPSRASPPFAVDGALNAKVILWEGDACALEVDALIAPAAAGYHVGASTVFQRVLRRGGRDLRADLRHLEACRSGEARLTKAYGLPCRWLLVTVGPKYKDKYQTAAQNTLNACYRECFQLLVEAELRLIAVPCIWYHKGYPPEEQAHVALRTVRRCLEKMRHAIETVAFAAGSPQELELYESLLPYYFPRTQAEANAGLEVLPDSCWSTWGEVAVEERRIRVSSHVLSSACQEDDDDDRGDRTPLFTAGDDDDRSFLDARSDADDAAMRRLEGTMIEAETPEMARQACLRYLRRAREVRTEPEATRFVYRARGQDRYNRRAVVLLGARLPALGVRDERTLPLFAKELELLRGERFVLLYVNSDVSALDSSKLEVLQEMLAVISARYRGSLDQLLVLHPGLWFRAAFALGRAVSDLAASVWHDTVYLEGLSDLATFFSLEQIGLPEYVRACDPG